MEQAATYFLKSAACSLVFLTIYSCFLKNATFFGFNRHFLLGGLLCSLLLPLYTYTLHVDLVVPAFSQQAEQVRNEKFESKALWVYLLPTVYTLGAIFLLIRNMTGLLDIRRLLKNSDKVKMPWGTLWSTSAFRSSFSVFNNIIIDPSPEISESERKMVFEHELAHVKQRHWIDLLVAQLFCTLNWFNPLSWLYLKAVKQNHEFLADRAVLEKGSSVAVYRAALINHTLGIPVFTFASTFAKNDKLKRVYMMDKQASGPLNKLAVLIALPALATILWAFAETEYTIKPADAKIITSSPVSSKVREDSAIAQPKQSFTRIEKVVIPAKKKLDTSKKKPLVNTVKEPQAPVSTPDKADQLPDVVIIQEPQQEAPVSGGLQIKPQPLYILDGEEIGSIAGIRTEDIQSIHVLKDASAIASYGEKGKNGVVVIALKK